MSEKKYYVPEIEELHPGFECEVSQFKDRWEKMKLSQNSIHQIAEILQNINQGSVRVPFLSDEDIVSAGWERSKHSSNWFFKGGRRYVIVMNREGSIKIKLDDKSFIFFAIRNKSELFKLLKQLGIV